MTYLITGIKNGIGRYLFQALGGVGLSRQTSKEEFESIKKKGADVIIHCAFNSRRDIDSNTLFGYADDNIFLTQRLTEVPHKKFILFSTVDVYPKDGRSHMEEEVISVDDSFSLHGLTKAVSESIVRRVCSDFLILRLSTLLGPFMRPNSLIRMMQDEDCVLTLAGDSALNYVSYSDVLHFLKTAIEKGHKGIFNVLSTENIRLDEIAARILKKKVIFGSYHYEVGHIDTAKIKGIIPSFSETSFDVIRHFLKERRE